MGNSESKERQLFTGIIMQLLNRRGIKVKKTSIQSFFTFVQEQCPWFPEDSNSYKPNDSKLNNKLQLQVNWEIFSIKYLILMFVC